MTVPPVSITHRPRSRGVPAPSRKPSPARGALVRLLMLPLKGLLTLTDTVASRLIKLD
jgi:hypothetical protein